jgi:hypothetical protein
MPHVQMSGGLRLVLSLVALCLMIDRAQAVPAFADQTGLTCTACHVGGFGPQLTPLGREFKLDGYTMRSGTDFKVPISAMAVASYLRTAKDQPVPPAQGYGANNNVALDQVSLFVAGGFGDHVGVLSQFTYDGAARAVAWDNLDLRAVDHFTWKGQDVMAGLVLNNNPGIEDAWNTLPGWGFAYTGSALAPSPGAGTVMAGALAQTVLGLNAYAWWNSSIYTEAGLYFTPGRGFLRAMGVDYSSPGPLSTPAPYLRVAYQKTYDAQNFELGAFGFFPSLRPGNDTSTGRSDHYRDLGVDASYQYTGSGANIYQVNAIFTHEQQSLNASALLGASQPHDTLDDFRVDGSYYWQNLIGGSVQAFDTWGSADPILFAGNSNYRPDSAGFVFQLDGTPFGAKPSSLGDRFNIRAGVQYTLYTKFNGAASNYDGSGRSASDNNALRLFLWFAL